jgi:hypothetical protein
MDGHWEHTEGHENICSLYPRVLPPGTAWLVTFVKSSVHFLTKLMGYDFQFLADRLILFQLGATLLCAPHPGFLVLATALWCFPKTILNDQAVKLEN